MICRTPVREFPYVIGFRQGTDTRDRRGIEPNDIVQEAVNPAGLVPMGKVRHVVLVEGSWLDGDAKGYLWLIPVWNDFWDARHSTNTPLLTVDEKETTAIVSSVGQTLPVIWEAPDDPNVEGTTHDRRHLDPTTIPLGGTVNIEGRITDGFGLERRAFGLVAFPEPLEKEEHHDFHLGMITFAFWGTYVWNDGSEWEDIIVNYNTKRKPQEGSVSGTTFTASWETEFGGGETTGQLDVTFDFSDTQPMLTSFTMSEETETSSETDALRISGSDIPGVERSGAAFDYVEFSVYGEDACNYISSLEHRVDHNTPGEPPGWRELRDWQCPDEARLTIELYRSSE